MSKVDGLFHHEIVKIHSAMKQNGLTSEELVKALEGDDFIVAKQKSRIIYLEAKLRKIEELLNDRQEN